MWDSWICMQGGAAAIGKQCFLAVFGLAAGFSVSSGVFTVFTAVGLVPRFAEHTKSGSYILKYENSIILGCFLGNLVSLFSEKLTKGGTSLKGLLIQVVGRFLPDMTMLFKEKLLHLIGGGVSGFIILFGLFVGIYVGTLAISIAEMLDALPIMTHRMNVKQGISFLIFGLAVGKLIGSVFYYMNGVYTW